MPVKVIKRDGRLQEFDLKKIIIVLERISDEMDEPLTASDLGNIADSVETRLYELKRENISTNEIEQILTVQLRELNFNKIANAYEEFEKSIK